MPLDVKSTIGAVALGAGGYLGWKFIKPDIVQGVPNVPNPQRLRQGRGSGRFYDVQGGALSWDDRFDEQALADGDDYIRDRFGRRARVGTPGSAWVAYEMIVEMHRRLYRFEALLARSFTEEQLEAFMRGHRQSGVYDLAGLSRRQTAILTHYVDCWIQLATCFRILSRLYRMARMPVAMRPTRYRLQRMDLSRLVIKASPFNPLNVGPADRTLAITTPGQWEIFGLQALQGFQQAYPTIVNVTGDDAAVVQQDLVETGQRHGTMGALPAVVWAVGKTIAVIIVALGVAAAIRKAIPAVMAFMGVKLEYLDALTDQFEEEMNHCAEGDLSACDRADTLAERIEQYDNGVGSLFRTIIVLGVVGVGSVAAFRWWKGGGRQQVKGMLSGRRKPKVLEEGGGR